MTDRRKVLVPFDRREVIGLKQAANIAGRTPETIRAWAEIHRLGRKVGGRWELSHPALLMFLDDDQPALKAYHGGERDGPVVKAYFTRAGM